MDIPAIIAAAAAFFGAVLTAVSRYQVRQARQQERAWNAILKTFENRIDDLQEALKESRKRITELQIKLSYCRTELVMLRDWKNEFYYRVRYGDDPEVVQQRIPPPPELENPFDTEHPI